jgi:hypothetical protein
MSNNLTSINVIENRGEMKNGQSRETGNIGYTIYRTKMNELKTQHIKLKRWASRDPTGGENRCWRRVSSYCITQHYFNIRYLRFYYIQPINLVDINVGL